MRTLVGLLLLALVVGGCAFQGVYAGTGYVPPPPSAYYTVRPTPYSSYSVGY